MRGFTVGFVGPQPHFARKLSLAGLPANSPPANSAGPLPSSQLASARTRSLVPPPSADQAVPLHFAILRTAWFPAVVKLPPA